MNRMMDEKHKKLATLLTYAGTLPFLAGIIVQIIGVDLGGLNIGHLVIAYGAVIVSFIAGIHWGIYMFRDSPLNLLIHSNMVALTAWITLYFMSLASFLILILCLVYLAVLDIKLKQADVLEGWFIKIRLKASGIVIVCLIINSLLLAF